MQDKMITATAADDSISVCFCNMKNTCEEAIKLHNLKGTAAIALCKALIGGSLLASTLKNDGDLATIIIRSEGPVEGITVTADPKISVKGYLHNPEAEAESVADLIGFGMLTITKDIGLREPYSGQLPLVTGEIAEDITAYFVESEQIATTCAIEVDFNNNGTVKAAGGFIIQLLPDTPYPVIDQLEMDLSRHPKPAELIEKYGDDYEKVLVKLLPAFDIHILDEKDIKWECNCSKERIEKVLLSMGNEELEAIISEGEDTEVVCDFCNKSYVFKPDDVSKLYEEAKNKGEGNG